MDFDMAIDPLLVGSLSSGALLAMGKIDSFANQLMINAVAQYVYNYLHENQYV